MIDPDNFDMYVNYRLHAYPYNTDPWEVLWAALWFASSV